MNVDTIVSDVKGAVEPYVAKGQDVVTLSIETLKQVNTVVVDGVQELVKTNVSAGKDLIAAAQSSFEKAKVDGIKAVAAAPVQYLPAGKDVILTAYKETITIVTKTGDELFELVKKGYSDVSAKLVGSTSVSAEATKAKRTVKKVAKKAAGAAKKAAR